MNNPSPMDRIHLSAVLIFAETVFLILVLAAVALHSGLQANGGNERGAAAFGALGMSVPALFPSARPERAPEWIDPRIDLRHSPFLVIPLDPPPPAIGSNPGRKWPSDVLPKSKPHD